MGERHIETDALFRGSKCGVNAGWLTQLLYVRKAATAAQPTPQQPNAEELWDTITNWGWAGPGFESKLGQMLTSLRETQHAVYHEGLELLGRSLGANPTRVTEPGAPDVVWSFNNGLHIAFEAKTEKDLTACLYKKDVMEAKGHADWVRARLCADVPEPNIATVMIAPSPTLDGVALPFAGGLFYLDPVTVLKIAERMAESFRKLRIQFSGRDFAEASTEFSAAVLNLQLH